MESISGNAPKLRDKDVNLCRFVVSNHAGNKQATRCRTRFMMLIIGGLGDHKP